MTARRDCACPRARHQHGTLGAYSLDRCRCLRCRMAKHWAMASYRSGETWRERDEEFQPKLPTVLRLRALMALGYTSTDLAEHTGLTYRHIQQLRNGTNALVGVAIAARVEAAYDRLWDVPSIGPRANRQRTFARHRGYLLPLDIEDALAESLHDTGGVVPRLTDEENVYNFETPTPAGRGRPPVAESLARTAGDVDDVAVERATLGERVPLNHAEMAEAIRRLTSMGHGAEAIGLRLRVSGRTVQRWRAVA